MHAATHRCSRAGNAYTTALMVLIVLVLFTLIFGAIAWLKHDEAVEHRTGFPDDPALAQTVDEALVTKLAEADKLRKSIADRDRNRRLLQQKAHELSVKVGVRGMAYDAYTAEGRIRAEREDQGPEVPIKLAPPKPIASAWDGSYSAVERYLKRIARDPDSVEIDECTEVRFTRDAWLVGCNWRGRNGFGGMNRGANWFSIRDGEVVEMHDFSSFRE